MSHIGSWDLFLQVSALGFTSLTCWRLLGWGINAANIQCSPAQRGSAGRALCAPGCLMWAEPLVCARTQVLAAGEESWAQGGTPAEPTVPNRLPQVACTPGCRTAALPSHQAAPAGRAWEPFGGTEFFRFFYPKLSIMLSLALWNASIKHSN